MAVVLPIISAIATASSATFAATLMGGGLAGFAAFASVAGGVMTGLGLLTKDKDLMKFGGLLSLASSATSLASSLSGASASGAASASGGATAGAKAVTESSATSASAATSAWESAAASAKLGDAAGLGAAGEAIGGSLAQTLPDVGSSALSGLGEAGANMSLSGGNLVDAARSAGYGASGAAQVAAEAPTLAQTLTQSAPTAIAEGAKTIKDVNHLQALLDKVNGLGKWVKDNKELVQFGGSALRSAFDPRYEELDYAKSLRNERIKNLNAPIAMRFTNPIVAARGNGG